MFTLLKFKPLRHVGARLKICGPPRRPPPGSCTPPPISCKLPPSPCIEQPPKCIPGPIPYNPCCPRFHHGKDTYKKFRNLFLFILLPIIIVMSLSALSHSPHHKDECRNYEYMRRRTKRFPWRDGNTTLFHNPDVNFLPEECEDVPPECD